MRTYTTAYRRKLRYKYCRRSAKLVRSAVDCFKIYRLRRLYRRNDEKEWQRIVFQPEYYGETIAHPFADLNNRTWLSFGGTKRGIDLAIKTYQTVINSNVRIYQADAKSVEMAKYMENAFLATKVTFCNEMYDIAMALGADYNLAREIWIADPRIGASHTFVYEDNRGYGGSCLPKDIASITTQGNKHGVDTTLLQSVIEKNSIYKKNEE